MKIVVRLVGIGLSLLACLAVTQTARAITYSFLQTGWEGGGEITGRIEIDESVYSGVPGLVGPNGVVDFHLHWSGNPYSQPHDWEMNGSDTFVWSAQDHNILLLAVGYYSDNVFYDMSGMLFDSAAGNVPNWPPYDPPELRYQYRTYTVGGVFAGHVPDGGSTFLFLGVALSLLAVYGLKFRHATTADGINLE